MTHKITYESTGKHESQTRTPVCSCGWRGTGIQVWNDWQYTLTTEEGAQHVRAALAAEAAVPN